MPGWPEWLQEELGLGDLVSQVPVQLGRATTGASTPRCLGWGQTGLSQPAQQPAEPGGSPGCSPTVG
jgi:hypothetical protein